MLIVLSKFINAWNWTWKLIYNEFYHGTQWESDTTSCPNLCGRSAMFTHPQSKGMQMVVHLVLEISSEIGGLLAIVTTVTKLTANHDDSCNIFANCRVSLEFVARSSP